MGDARWLWFARAAACALALGCGGDDDGGGGGGAPDGGRSLDAASGAPGVTVSVAGPGRVTSTPAGIDCDQSGGAGCTAAFGDGQVVTLTATAGASAGFEGWSGTCAGTDGSVMVTVDGSVACGAAFVGIEGDVVFTPPPTSVVPNVTEGDDILMFVEQASTVLPVDLPFDLHVAQFYVRDTPTLDQGVVPAGTTVSVYFIHYDLVGKPVETRKQAVVTFPRPIIALTISDTGLDATDSIVGRDDVLYPAPGTERGRRTELDFKDELTISDDRRTLTMDFATSISADQIRVVLASPGGDVPLVSSTTAAVAAPPASVVLGATESDTAFVVFEEVAELTLAADVAVDVSEPGLFDQVTAPTPAVIGAGATVGSYLVHFDAVGTAPRFLRGSITLDADILGIVIGAAGLDASAAVLDRAGTAYPASGAEANRGLEIPSPTDTLRWAGDRRSVRFELTVAADTDQMRILVAR